jgi:hypothetical protein
VRFVPSRVEGVSGVCEVAVFPDRLEVLGERGWVAVSFADFAKGAQKSWLLNRKPKLGRVGAILYSTQRYGDSHVRFLTDPPITIYMPANGPTQFPHSVFWQIQRTIRSGRYELIDLGGPPPDHEPIDSLPRPFRAVIVLIFCVAILNFAAFFLSIMIVGGGPGKVVDGHYYVGKTRHQREVSREKWLWVKWHERLMIATHCLAIFGGGGLILYGNARWKRDAKQVVKVEGGGNVR